jgi:hypothetical protein
VGGLIIAAAGTLYGATYTGGGGTGACSLSTPGCGIAFKITQPARPHAEHILAKFGEGAGDGANPNGGLLAGPGGDLFGVTYDGGGSGCGSGCGTIYELRR